MGRTEMSKGNAEFLKILDEMRELHERKSAEYGQSEDAFTNVRSSKAFGVPPWVGVMIRAHDKMIRVQSFLQNGSLKNESLEDSLMDLAAYAVIALALRREEVADAEKVVAHPPGRCGDGTVVGTGHHVGAGKELDGVSCTGSGNAFPVYVRN